MAESVWHDFRPVEAEFLNHAPVVHRIESVTRLPRQAVWDAFADPTGWKHWFPFTENAIYEGGTPYGIGTIRKSWVGGERFEETMLIWDEPRRWGYRIDRATQALAGAQIELTEFETAPEGTRVIWTLACEPLPGLSFLSGDADFPAFLKDMLDKALRALEAHLAKN